MKILTDRSFERDAKKLLQSVQLKVKLAIDSILQASNLSSLQVTKMEGAKNAYRLRVGYYRIGFYLEYEIIVLSRVLKSEGDISIFSPKIIYNE